mgnify:FL=1
MSRKNGGIIGPANTPVGGLLTGVASGVWRTNDLLNFVSNNQWPKTPQNIENSLRFDDGSSDYLSITPGSSSNTKKWTFSCWIKLGNIKNSFHSIFSAFTGSTDQYNAVALDSSNRVVFVTMDEGSGGVMNIISNAMLRDPSAWYHIVTAYDSAQATDTNRVKGYINGTQVTSFSTSNYPAQDKTTYINSNNQHNIGKRWNANYYDGYMAEVVFIDGQALDPTSFGETDSATGIWKPKKIGQIANAGSNSFYLNFKDSSNLGKDESGNSNNFTVNNLTSIDQATDTCVENFATLNPLTPTINTTHVYTHGNLTAVPTYVSAGGVTIFHTINPLQGKWYYEIKAETSAGSGNAVHTGVVTGTSATNYTSSSTQSGAEFDIFSNNIEKRSEGSSSVISGSSFSSGDIGMIAVDMDNGKIYIGKNGTWLESSNPATSSNPSVSFTVTNDLVFFTSPVTNSGNSNKAKVSMNFGNAPFSISSGNSDANGFGNFEYAVPSGYYALNTSNLNTYG